MKRALIVLGLLLIFAAVLQSAAPELTIVSYGSGAYQESHKRAFVEPFGRQTSTKMTSLSWGAEYGHLQEMVRSGRVPWNVVEVTAAQYARGVGEKLFAPLTSTVPTSTYQPIPGSPAPTQFGVPNVYWSTVLAYRSDAVKKPRSWSNFWDTKNFPGPRALYDSPRGTLEFALLADGVPRDRLYPLDVNRAFRKLNQIRPSVRLWWQDGTEPVNALLTGRVVMTPAWSGRIFASPQARKELRYSWDGAAHELDYWVIPKGAANVPLATRFIHFASMPAPMAVQASSTAYGPANNLALAQVPKNILPELPTAPSNWRISFVVDSAWWAAHEQEVQERWTVWRSGS